jgi:parallel beta-helix repeat protein
MGDSRAAHYKERMTTPAIVRGRTGGMFAGALMLFAFPASAATLTVGVGSGCPGAAFTTIQSAIDAAGATDRIDVCAGTYPEQLTIPAGKDGLVLRATTALAAIIQAPASMADPGDIVRVNAARDVTIEGFTISGPLPDALFCSTYTRTGVRVDGAGSARVRGNHITEIRSATDFYRGCENGVSILVGRQSESEVGTATIEDNTIDAYQKTGIVVENDGSSAIITGNRVIGDGPNLVIGQNGIEISLGADGFVGQNWVAGQIYSPSPAASGLIFYLAGRVTAIGNQVRDADYGIWTLDTAGSRIEDNVVSSCTADGIALGEDTIGTTNAVVTGNESHDNGEDGLFVSSLSKDNAIVDNRLFADRGLDAEDDSVGHGTAGTANRWHGNRCKTDNHGGLLCDGK